MVNSICRSLCAVFIAVVFGVLAAPGTVGIAQDTAPPNKKEDKKSAKQETDKKQAKQEREYQKIKEFSENLYNTDTSFRDEVEAAYRQKQKEHSEYAYFTNTLDSHDEQITRTGDRLKVDDTLYDNPLVQDYVNRVGQSIAPKDSKKLYAFDVIYDYMQEVGEMDWAARPALNISTKNIEPIGIQGGLTAPASPQVPAAVTVTPASVTPASAPQAPTKSRKP